MLGADRKATKKQMGWRIDAELADYIQKAGEVSGQTNIVEDAVRLHRTLAEVLHQHMPRLVAFARDNALVMRDHESAVIAKLVLLGLEAHEKNRKR
jgi:hypothetical protein